MIGATLFAPLLAAFRPRLKSSFRGIKRLPIDVTGIPTPPHLIMGRLGVEYFKATGEARAIGVWMNGVRVDCEASEVDTKAGWVRMYQPGPDGKFVINWGENGGYGYSTMTYRHGKYVRTYAGPDAAFLERIHFGDVRVEVIGPLMIDRIKSKTTDSGKTYDITVSYKGSAEYA